MSDCRVVADRLAPYVDGLLPSAEQNEVDRHLAGCHRCQSLARDEQAGQSLLRSRARQLLAEPLPPGLRTRCEALAAARRGSPERLAGFGSWWRVRMVPVALTVVVMIFTASTLFSLATRRSDGLLAAQLAADHAKCFRLFGPPEGTAVDARLVERQLSQEYGWTVHLPSSSADTGLQLVGARRCLYGDGLIPHVLYRVHGQDVSLFVLAGTARRAADLVTLGHRSRIWSRDDTTYVWVSPVAAGDMVGATRYVMQEAH